MTKLQQICSLFFHRKCNPWNAFQSLLFFWHILNNFFHHKQTTLPKSVASPLIHAALFFYLVWFGLILSTGAFNLKLVFCVKQCQHHFVKMLFFVFCFPFFVMPTSKYFWFYYLKIQQQHIVTWKCIQPMFTPWPHLTSSLLAIVWLGIFLTARMAQFSRNSSLLKEGTLFIDWNMH